MSSSQSSRSASPANAEEEDAYGSDTFASDPSVGSPPSSKKKKRDGCELSTTQPAESLTSAEHGEVAMAAANSSDANEAQHDHSTGQKQDDLVNSNGGVGSGPRRNPTSEARRRNNAASSSGGDTAGLSATRHQQQQQQQQGSKKGGGPAAGKMLKYSSAETFFSPAHVPINEQSEKALITRLYNPEPLKKRTLMDLEQRRQVQQAYDSSVDHHLCQYWDRKQQIRNKTSSGSKRQENIGDTEVKSTRPRTTSPPQDRSGDGGSESSPDRCHTSPVSGRQKHKASGSSAASPASSSRRGRGGYRSSSQSSTRRTSTASSSASSNSSRESSPEWTEQRSSSKPREHRPGDKLATGHKSNNSSITSRKFIAGLPISVWSIVAKFLEEKDLVALHGCARGLTLEALSNSNSRAVVLTRSQNGGDSNSSPSRSRSGFFDRGDDDGFDPVTNIHRRDLTALWMVARPSSAFQRVVARFSFHHHDFNLSWMVRKAQPPASGGTIMQIPTLYVPSSSQSGGASSPDAYRLSSPRSVLVLLRNGLTLKDLVAIPLSVFYNEGSLRGIPKAVSEIGYAAHEKQRQKHLSKVRRDYAALCKLITLKELTDMLFRVNPDEHTDAPIHDDDEEIRPVGLSEETGLTVHDPSGDGGQRQQHVTTVVVEGNSAVRLRADRAMEQQTKQQEKYMTQLTRNAELMRKRTERAREQEETALRKYESLRLQHEAENQQRKEKIAQRAEKLKQVQQDAKLREELRQKFVLEKIHAHESHQQKLDEQRRLQHLIQQEERKVINERKRERVDRCEKQNDFERLCVVDKIRRKAAKIDAVRELSQKMTLELKHNREKASIEMQLKAEQFSSELLAFQRKCDFEQINNKSSSRSRHRRRIDDATAAGKSSNSSAERKQPREVEKLDQCAEGNQEACDVDDGGPSSCGDGPRADDHHSNQPEITAAAGGE